MKITVFSRYSRLGASSRLRSLQYVPELQRAGFAITVMPFFDDDYLSGLYSGDRSRFKSLKFYAGRIVQTMAVRDANLFWIEKELMPWVPWALERLILPRKTPYVVDYDDAVFHRYDHDCKGIIRTILHDKIDKVMEHAACVMVGNEYLASRASAAGATRIERVPTVVDIEKYGIKTAQHKQSHLRVGWIGTPKTWKSSAQPIYQALTDTLTQTKAGFRAIGASLDPSFDGVFENVPWTEDEEIRLIQSLDVGIMPLPDDPWTRGKCGYKLIQYMACGIPVVASPIGINTEIVRHGVNGFLAANEEEWNHAVRTLLLDEDLRNAMGDCGRRQVEERYSLQAWTPKLNNILKSLC